jgi:CDP-glucose 4,6-dehydratase
VSRSFWDDKRVLVTGNTGFKGSWLSLWLTRQGAEVVGLSLPPDTKPSLYEAAALAELVPTHTADVCDERAVSKIVAAARCDVVFHLAAQPLVRASYEAPLRTYATNVMGTANLLEAIRNSSTVRAVVCVTSDKCYDNREWVWPYRETDPLGGYDPYSSSKACAEIVAAAFARSYFSTGESAGIASARSGNVVGGGDWSPDRVVPDLVRAFHDGTTAVIRNPDAVRPWQSVLDALNGYLVLAERLYQDPHAFAEPWNFGPEPSAERKVADLANRLQRAWGNGARWSYQASKSAPHEASTLKLDSSKARARLSWHNVFDIDQTVDRLAHWYTQYYDGAYARDLMESDIVHFTVTLGGSA